MTLRWSMQNMHAVRRLRCPSRALSGTRRQTQFPNESQHIIIDDERSHVKIDGTKPDGTSGKGEEGSMEFSSRAVRF